jgi:hypothetical protein
MDVMSRYHLLSSRFRVASHARACSLFTFTAQLPGLKPCSLSLQMVCFDLATVEKMRFKDQNGSEVDEIAHHP